MAQVHGHAGQRTAAVSETSMRVGFIGLGRMGAPMAARIAAAGHRVTGHDVAAERRQAAQGVAASDSAAAAVEDAEIVVTSLPGPTEVEAVVRGVLPALKPGAIVVETSTIAPQQSRELAGALAARSVSYLDAPVSGGAHGARDGTLLTVVGGEPDVLERARPVLSCFARTIFHLGPVGAGNTMKLVIQSIFLSQMAVFLEAVSMGERSGIAIDTLLSVIAASSAHHPTVATRYDKLRTGNLEPMFEVGSAIKDLSLAETLWHEHDRPLAALMSALSDYRGAAADGLSGADLVAVRNWLNRGK
jgi:3-hydroxyisobutyrate dehydrogenase-like beta-hydroxyacid dehydrogenase